MDQDYGTPITPVEEPKKFNPGWIIAIVILVLLCGCCAILALFYFVLGDPLLEYFQNLVIDVQSSLLPVLWIA